MYRLLCILIGIDFAVAGGIQTKKTDYGERYLLPGHVYSSHSHSQDKLSIYCYAGTQKHILHSLQSVYLSTTLKPNEYDLYKGETPVKVFNEFENLRSSWTAPLFTWRSKTISLNPFNTSCVGIFTALDYNLEVKVTHVDFWRVIVLVGAIVLFLAAPKLSSNPLFYYVCGVTIGVTTSFLILVYLVSRLIPKRPAVYTFLVGGWTIGVYLFQILWQNIKTVIVDFQNYVVAYFVLTGLISFVFCYRFGPVTDQRSKNLIKWMLQGISLIGIFFCSEYKEASVLFNIVLLSYYNFPAAWSSSIVSIWKKRFPPKRKLLSEDEYHEQGAKETVKALDELRKYCSSPECNQWRTVLSLRQPIRFAQFVEGKSHLMDDEVLEYESESRKGVSEITDDSESSDE